MEIYDVPVLGRKILNSRIALEGGEKTSTLARRRAMSLHNVEVGKYSYGGCFAPAFNVGGASVRIGRYCSIAQRVSYFGASHPVEHAVMSPYFYNSRFGGYKVDDVSRYSLEIGNDVWLGYGVIITPGCKSIGNGAVVGGGSVVTCDVEPYSIVVGNPAKMIKMRFDTETITALEQSSWWDLDPDELMVYYDLMQRPLEFARAIISGRQNVQSI